MLKPGFTGGSKDLFRTGFKRYFRLRDGRFPVDKPAGRRLYTTHRRAVRLRRDCAPLILTYVWTEPPRRSRWFNFVGFSARPERLETARFPGCLTSESEERETWTAESLRTAITERATFLRCGHGRDFGGQRLRYIADLLFFGRKSAEQLISGWTSSKRVICQNQSHPT